MYVNDTMNDAASYQPQRQLRRRDRDTISKRRFTTATTSVALTDNFDAPTEAPTEWNATGIDGVEGRDYDVSISGYRNYVNEVERMLSSQADISIDHPYSPYQTDRNAGVAESVRETDSGRPARRTSLHGYASMDNVRDVAGRRAKVELVEHRIMEDTPARTISLWREQVAESTEDLNRPINDQNSDAVNSHPDGHHVPANDVHAGRIHASRTVNRSSGSGSGGYGREASKGSSGDYQRTEYLISYQKPSRHAGAVRQLYTPSLNGHTSSGRRNSGSSSKPSAHRRSISPEVKKTPAKLYERTEYMVSYLTPPHSQGSERSSSKPRGKQQHAYQQQHQQPLSPVQSRTYVPVDALPTGSAVKASSTSPVELILASCEPPLVHIAPVLSELGIHKMEHLRAVARMNEDTRDRELKHHALMRGVTVVEWAILLDRLQTL